MSNILVARSLNQTAHSASFDYANRCEITVCVTGCLVKNLLDGS